MWIPPQGDYLETQTRTSRNSPIDEAPQRNPFHGRYGAEGGRRSTAIINIATYNVRTLSHPDDLDRLQEQLEDFNWSILGLCETKRKGEGLTELKDGTWTYDVEKKPEEDQSLQIIQVYAPTPSYDDADIDIFYDDLES
ncbi:endonuclease-reverse transcriptase [Elysia marginata]|uniref:Endonuclease-reverse transcriptase n=1 Tax=Elysia marginata TaxID=1093978 RepID=A0AAV4EFR1_9GAST|nr:endonuclease-reverse transcriptase [Elysia marginata]